MTDQTTTNDDLASYLARKRRSETFREMNDVEIVQNGRTKIEFFFAIYIALALCVAYTFGERMASLHYFLPLPLLYFGALFFFRRLRRMSTFLALLAARR
jgi:hypothetical protein